MTDRTSAIDRARFTQTVLVLQGGGALGAYQAGVYQAMCEVGVEVDWVIGTSIGAINAALIAGAAPHERIDRLGAFWRRVEHRNTWPEIFSPWINAAARNMAALSGGIPGFFTPQTLPFLSQHLPLGPEGAGYYSVAPLVETLGDLIDFGLVNSGPIRLTVGAANVRTSEMRYFDSREMPLDLRHVLASGALPPAFPAVRIDGDLYWDGGIVSNTPVEAVFDDMPRRNSLVFAVHLWNPNGQEPETMWEVSHRQKDLQYSSRAASHIHRQRQLHKLRHVIAELAALVPPERRDDPRVRELTGYGCHTQTHVVRLLAPALDYEDHAKDLDFSARGIAQRREAGYRHTLEMLEKRPWDDPVDPLEGFVLHEACAGEIMPVAPVPA